MDAVITPSIVLYLVSILMDSRVTSTLPTTPLEATCNPANLSTNCSHRYKIVIGTVTWLSDTYTDTTTSTTINTTLIVLSPLSLPSSSPSSPTPPPLPPPSPPLSPPPSTISPLPLQHHHHYHHHHHHHLQIQRVVCDHTYKSLTHVVPGLSHVKTRYHLDHKQLLLNLSLNNWIPTTLNYRLPNFLQLFHDSSSGKHWHRLVISYNVHRTLYNIHCTLYSVHYI